MKGIPSRIRHETQKVFTPSVTQNEEGKRGWKTLRTIARRTLMGTMEIISPVNRKGEFHLNRVWERRRVEVQEDSVALTNPRREKHGIQGLYKGMEVKLSQTVLTAALMLLAYEESVSFIFCIFLHRPILK
ncbi:hypothetical protein ANTQUA_LOCUS1469 [Anthophora quadrimaculata]